MAKILDSYLKNEIIYEAYNMAKDPDMQGLTMLDCWHGVSVLFVLYLLSEEDQLIAKKLFSDKFNLTRKNNRGIR